jgi:1-deoxy-D-xylulose-5-phosphate synthase
MPFVIRYPRGEGVMPEWKTAMEEVEIGRGRRLKTGTDVAIVSLGHPGNFAQAAIRQLRTQGIDPAHYDMRFVKPLDEELLHEVFSNYTKVVTIEDGTVVGGFGSAVLEFMNAHRYNAEVTILGIPDRLVEHGTPKELHRECNYDAQAIEEAVLSLMKEKVTTKVTIAG